MRTAALNDEFSRLGSRYDATATWGPTRLKAVDQFGNGVDGLELQLRVIHDENYPDFAPWARVATCGTTHDDSAGMQYKPCVSGEWGSPGEAIMMLQPEYGEENGAAMFMGTAAFSRPAYQYNIPEEEASALGAPMAGGWGEHVMEAPTGTLLLEYVAYQPGSENVVCRSDPFRVGIESPVTRIDINLALNADNGDDLANPDAVSVSYDYTYGEPSPEVDVDFASNAVDFGSWPGITPPETLRDVEAYDGATNSRPMHVLLALAKAWSRDGNLVPDAQLVNLQTVHVPQYHPGWRAAQRTCNIAQMAQAEFEDFFELYTTNVSNSYRDGSESGDYMADIMHSFLSTYVGISSVKMGVDPCKPWMASSRMGFPVLMWPMEAREGKPPTKIASGLGIEQGQLTIDRSAFWGLVQNYEVGADTLWPNIVHADDPHLREYAVLNSAHTSVTAFDAGAFPNYPGFMSTLIASRAGASGRYAFVFEAGGVRSDPILLTVPSRAATIALIRQPTTSFALCGSGAGDTGCPANQTGLWPLDGEAELARQGAAETFAWPVGQPLETTQAPVVQILDEAGLPLSGYRLVARAVLEDGETRADDVMLEISRSERYNPLGVAMSIVSTDEGLAYFPTLAAFDGLDGARFRLRFFFDPDGDGEGKNAIAITSETRFELYNRNKISVSKQPSSLVSPAVPFPDATEVRLEVPMLPVVYTVDNVTTIDHYKVPALYSYMVYVLTLVPFTLDDERIAPYERRNWAANYLNSYRCASVFGTPLGGPCTMVGMGISGATVKNVSHAGGDFCTDFRTDATAEEVAHIRRYSPRTFSCGYEASIEDVVPKWAVTLRFNALEWLPRSPARQQLVLMATSAWTRMPEELVARTQLTSDVTLDTTPASAVMLVQPPATVHMGQLFLLKVQVRISSGSPIAGVSVLATPAAVTDNGATITIQQFFSGQFGEDPLSTFDAPPLLDPERQTATTDASGIARFVMQFTEGPPDELVRIRFTAGKAEATTRIFHLHNDVEHIELNITGDAPLAEKGVIGVGSPYACYSSAWKAVEGNANCSVGEVYNFPIRRRLPTIRLRATDLHGADITAPGSLNSPIDLYRQYVKWRVFTREQETLIENQTNAGNDAMTRLRNLTRLYDGTSDEGLQAMEEMFSATEAGQAAAQELMTGNVSGALAEARDAMNTLQDGALGSLRSETMDIFSLLVSGARFRFFGPTQGSQKAEVVETEDLAVTFAEGGVVEISGLELYVRASGEFRLQVLVQGIASSIEGDFVYLKYQVSSLTNLGLQWATRIFGGLAVGLLLLGNADFHWRRLHVLLPLSVLVALLMYVVLTEIPFTEGRVLYPRGDVTSKGLWFSVAFPVLIIFYLLAEVGRRRGSGPLRPHADKQREAYFDYVLQLTKKGWNPEQKRLQDAENGRITITLQERMELERIIQQRVLSDRKVLVQIKSIVRCMRGKENRAFFFPMRLWIALTIALFLTVFFIASFHNGIKGLERTLHNLDIKSLDLIDKMVLKLQDLYLELTGFDLPEYATAWAFDAKNELHRQVLALVDAFDGSYIAASTVGCLCIVVAWVDVATDLRCEVIQARQGIWQFNRAKVQTIGAFTYVGTQVSNAMFTYALMTIILTPIFTIVSWQVTRELLWHLVKNNVNMIISLALAPVINVVIKLVAKKFIYDAKNKSIKNKLAFMAFDLVQLMTYLVAGITAALVRFVLVVVISMFSLTRVTKSPMPNWMETYLLLDTGSKSYQGLIVLMHRTCHPVMRVAIYIMEEDSVRRRQRVDGLVTPEKRRASNRWNLMWLLYKNPTLRTYRYDAEAAEEIKRAKAEKSVANVIKRKLKKEKEVTEVVSTALHSKSSSPVPGQQGAAPSTELANLATAAPEDSQTRRRRRFEQPTSSGASEATTGEEAPPDASPEPLPPAPRLPAAETSLDRRRRRRFMSSTQDVPTPPRGDDDVDDATMHV